MQDDSNKSDDDIKVHAQSEEPRKHKVSNMHLGSGKVRSKLFTCQKHILIQEDKI